MGHKVRDTGRGRTAAGKVGGGVEPPARERITKSGLPPGTLIHIGEKSDEEIRITVMDYHEGGCEEKTITALNECFYFSDGAVITWIDVERLHEIEIIQQMGDCQGLHPLVLEDILNTNQRPKLEDYGDYLYIVLKRLFRDDDGRVGTEQISLILGANFVISFQEGIRDDLFSPVKERLRSGKGKIRGMGADYLAYSLMDAVVDTYFDVIDGAEETIEALEEEVTFSPVPETVRELHRLKREMIFLRKVVWPLREVLVSLTRRESKLVSEPVVIYLRDVYDHTIHVIDSIEANRDMLSGMLDIYLSSMSNRMNEVMKVLTLIATIFMPITFIVGLYGMNFKNMPELEWRWGYPAVLLLMVVVTAGMVVWFKRKKWL